MQYLFDELKDLALTRPEGKIMFNIPVVAERTPHHLLFTCYGIIADEVHGVWIMDIEGQWLELKPGQANASYIILSLLQRIKLMNYESKALIPAQ